MTQSAEHRYGSESLGAPSDFPSSSLPDFTFEPSVVRRQLVATFLFARVHNFAACFSALDCERATAFVAEIRRVLSEPIATLAGEIAHRRSDSILAVFCNPSDEARPDHAQRGLHAAVLMVHELVQVAETLSRQCARFRVPPPVMTVGVHLGMGELSRRVNAPAGKVSASGESVEIARALAAAAMELRWSIAASAGTHVAAAGRMESGRSGRISVGAGGSLVETVEISGLAARKGSHTPATVFDALRASLQLNHRVGNTTWSKEK